MNTITIAGNLIADPKALTHTKGSDMTSFRLADNVWDGKEKIPVYFDCIAFGKNARFLSESFRRGDGVVISGELSIKLYQDKTYLKVMATNIGFPPSSKKQTSQEPAVSQNTELINKIPF